MNNARAGRIILYAALIFVAGFATGTLLAPIFGRTFMRPPAPHEMSQHMLSHIQSCLHLTDQQLAEIKPLVEKTGADMENIHNETMKRVMACMAETNAQISSFLTPEQKAEFARMQSEHRKFVIEHHHFGSRSSPSPDSK